MKRCIRAQSASGVSYVDVCRQAAARGDSSATEALAGCGERARRPRDVFQPGVPAIPTTKDDGMRCRWCHFSARNGGAVVSHVEVTARKRAELEAQRARAGPVALHTRVDHGRAYRVVGPSAQSAARGHPRQCSGGPPDAR